MSDSYLIPQPDEVLVNQIFHKFLNIIGPSASYHKIAKTHITKIILIIAFQKFLAVQVVTGNIVDKESFSSCFQILQNEVFGNFILVG